MSKERIRKKKKDSCISPSKDVREKTRAEKLRSHYFPLYTGMLLNSCQDLNFTTENKYN